MDGGALLTAGLHETKSDPTVTNNPKRGNATRFTALDDGFNGTKFKGEVSGITSIRGGKRLLAQSDERLRLRRPAFALQTQTGAILPH